MCERPRGAYSSGGASVGRDGPGGRSAAGPCPERAGKTWRAAAPGYLCRGVPGQPVYVTGFPSVSLWPYSNLAVIAH